MSIEQIREIIQRDGFAHIPSISIYTKTRSEEIYVTEITGDRVIGFVFDGQRKDFKRPINTSHNGTVFSIGGGSGKRRFYLKNVDPVHVDYLYDVVGVGGVAVKLDHSGCTSKHTFYGMDLNLAQAYLLCQQVRKSGLDVGAWAPPVGEYGRVSGKGPHYRPGWKQMDKVTFNLQKVVD